MKLAEAYGAEGYRATQWEEVIPVLRQGLSSSRPAIMDFLIEREECVYPMVPAGRSVTDMMLPESGSPIR